MEQLESLGQALRGQRWIVTWAFIAQERVGPVHFVPSEVQAGLVEASPNSGTALQGNMGILPAPEEQEFARYLGGARQGVIALALAKGARVDVGGIETDGGRDVRLHRRPEGQVAAEADAEDAEFA